MRVNRGAHRAGGREEAQQRMGGWSTSSEWSILPPCSPGSSPPSPPHQIRPAIPRLPQHPIYLFTPSLTFLSTYCWMPALSQGSRQEKGTCLPSPCHLHCLCLSWAQVNQGAQGVQVSCKGQGGNLEVEWGQAGTLRHSGENQGWGNHKNPGEHGGRPGMREGWGGDSYLSLLKALSGFNM